MLRFADVGMNISLLCHLRLRRLSDGRQGIGTIDSKLSDLSTTPVMSMTPTFWLLRSRTMVMVVMTKDSTGFQKLNLVRWRLTAATCGLSSIRHPSLTMPGEGGLQSMTTTRRAASQRRNYKSDTEDLEVLVFTFMPLAERLCRQVQPSADMRLQSSQDLIYQESFNEHAGILRGFTISSKESHVQR